MNRMRRITRIHSIFWLFIFSGGALIAQETMSLADAIQLGLKNNYDISLSQANVDVAANNNSWGEAGRWPSLLLRLSQPNTITDNVEVASPFQPKDIFISNSLSGSAEVNWMLFEGMRANITKERLDQLQRESEGNAAVVLTNTLQAIILGYYLAKLEKERLSVFEKTLTLSRDKYHYIKTKKGFGAAVTSDLLLEEGNYLTDSVNYVNQELAYRNAVRNFNMVLALDDLDKEYDYVDELEVPVNNYEFKDLFDKMSQSNVDLTTKYISQSIIKEDLRLAQSERYPKLSAGLSGGTTMGRVDQSNASFFNQSTGEFVSGPEEILSTRTNTYSLTFTLTYNLFNGHRIDRAIKNAMIREDIGNIEIDKLKLSLKNDLLTAHDEYQIRQRLYGINKRRLDAAELNLQISEDKFKLGAINSFDFRTVQVNYLTAALQELNSRYSLIDSDVTLLRLTGGIVEVYK